MTSSVPSPRRLGPRAQLDLTPDRLAPPVLILVAVVSAAFIYHQTRGSSFSPDDLAWISTRRGDNVGTFLAPYNGHLSLIPIAIYRVMFAVEGIGSFAPYRVLLAVVATLAGLVFFEYAHHRVGAFCALLLTTLLLFLGPGWNDIMQPFQIGWLIAVGGGVLALSLLDRRGLGTDLVACMALLVAVCATSVGVALLVGAAVDVALARRRWRDAWIAGVPLVLYVAWALHYHASTIAGSALTEAPLNLLQTTAAAVAGVVGLSAVTPTDLTGVMLTFGVSLLALAAVVVIIRLPAGWDGTRFISLAVALVVFSLLTTLVRSFQSPFESRYMYVTCVLVALLAVELVRGVPVSPRMQVVLATLTLAAVISDLSDLRSGGAEFRQLGAQTDATLGAVALDRGRVAPGQALTQLPLNGVGFDFTAGDYFSAEAHSGHPRTPSPSCSTHPLPLSAAPTPSCWPTMTSGSPRRPHRRRRAAPPPPSRATAPGASRATAPACASVRRRRSHRGRRAQSPCAWGPAGCWSATRRRSRWRPGGSRRPPLRSGRSARGGRAS
jgi:hypothetical protein